MSDPSWYVWQRKYKDKDAEWEQVELEEAKKYLSNAYIDISVIMSAMMTGLVAQTPFAVYRAVPKNLLDTALA